MNGVCMCMHVFVCVCMYVYGMNVYVCVCMFMYVYVCIFTYRSIYLFKFLLYLFAKDETKSMLFMPVHCSVIAYLFDSTQTYHCVNR